MRIRNVSGSISGGIKWRHPPQLVGLMSINTILLQVLLKLNSVGASFSYGEIALKDEDDGVLYSTLVERSASVGTVGWFEYQLSVPLENVCNCAICHGNHIIKNVVWFRRITEIDKPGSSLSTRLEHGQLSQYILFRLVDNTSFSLKGALENFGIQLLGKRPSSIQGCPSRFSADPYVWKAKDEHTVSKLVSPRYAGAAQAELDLYTRRSRVGNEVFFPSICFKHSA